MTVSVTNPREGKVVLKHLMTNVNYDGVHSCKERGERGRERERERGRGREGERERGREREREMERKSSILYTNVSTILTKFNIVGQVNKHIRLYLHTQQ